MKGGLRQIQPGRNRFLLKMGVMFLLMGMRAGMILVIFHWKS